MLATDHNARDETGSTAQTGRRRKRREREGGKNRKREREGQGEERERRKKEDRNRYLYCLQVPSFKHGYRTGNRMTTVEKSADPTSIHY